MDFPEHFQYTKDHEWIEFDAQTNVAKIGITEYAQEKLGDVVHVELLGEGSEIKSEESFGSVESVKAVSDIYSPVTGKIKEINTLLKESPQMVNEDPYGEAWMITLEVSDASKLKDLMNATQYQEYLDSEE